MEQETILSRVYSEVYKERTMRNLESEINISILKVFKFLFYYGHREVFEECFLEACIFLYKFKN